MEEKRENVVFFPFMAQGHIIPFLALALQIEQKGYEITFVNTPLNIKKLRQTLPPESSISLVEIPFNSADHGLPPDSENTDSLPYNLIFRLLEVSPCLEPAFRKLLSDLIQYQGVKPLCVIADFFFGWSANVAHEFGLYHAIFSGAGGYGLACYYSVWLNLPHRKTDDHEFALPDFPEAGKFHVTQLSASFLVADGSDPYTRFQWQNLPTWVNSDGLLFNTVEDLDKTGLMYFRRKLGRPVWAVGPILLSVQDRARSGRRESGITPDQCVEWLDTKAERSVLYISFGSQNTISATQMMQLAKALDGSGRNFIWVVKPPLGFDANAEFRPEEWLPEGFARRVEDERRGLIVLGWAPQLEILSHKSVGAFMSHCGWNSVIESLSNGVPLIGWPMAAEQYFNAKLLVEETGVCAEVARGTSFEVRQEDILEKIELVMGDNDKAREIMKRATEVQGIIQDAIRDEEDFKGSSVRAMEDFFSAAFAMKQNRKDETQQ